MNTSPNLKVITVALVVALTSCASPPATQKMPVSASIRPNSPLTEQVLSEVNSYRRNHGAIELKRHAGLDRLAQQHCEYLRKNRGSFAIHGKNISHMGFEGRALAARVNYQMENISENVAATTNPGQNTASTLVKLWSESKDHDFNMRSAWTYTGIGLVVDNDGMVFSTELFATMTQSHMITRERFNRF
jgi:uncharacterized protein YkwD